ncbi:gamma-type small acid-soluble spore protein [Rossellomorea marisflavi]|uniref:Small, acid-soluble spore protein gamma-type n=1 Tax=Rossellomorea marisflavi TaxID=189381 RepID=A0A165JLB7_9BACI|nr:gamma-type small acid-soluble spore protein [Rossellomorea marisflavi]KMK90432.1 spore protein [Rossellomorea marisflavi]KZE46544.1 spore protein [Rossellomorea marisflavi]QHA35677.1 gamma-type small acid-soluble spore protein [Rossellomorea marisflavi]TYO71103.1 gamma-type small acid-soluble spore protein [Rossellomorea marisflavi]USK93590.1 gamma-type small acid-soluble spore protein [Rossellomorea marisflavi]
MAKQNNKTNMQQQQKQQNAGQQQYGTEFASETNAQEVKKQNQQSAQKNQK